ncbi:MAG: NUDIX hydrolase [Candidatus Woesearchaeota archaeon]
MLYFDIPVDFKPQLEAAGCFIEYDRSILLLLRQPFVSPQGNRWGLPSGKLEASETSLEGILREVKEETGILLVPSLTKFLSTAYVRYPELDFTYHIFQCALDKKPKVRLNLKEHKSFDWVLPIDSLNMPLMLDLDTCVKFVYK